MICRKCASDKPNSEFWFVVTNGVRYMRKSCASCEAARIKKWRTENRSLILEKIKVYNDANACRRRAYSRLWAQSNPERVRQSQRAWKEKNRDEVRMRGRLYQAARRAGDTKPGRTLLHELMELQKGLCVVCVADIRTRSHLDHIVPVSKGGGNERENLQLLCPSCNCRKNAMPMAEFIVRFNHAR